MWPSSTVVKRRVSRLRPDGDLAEPLGNTIEAPRHAGAPCSVTTSSAAMPQVSTEVADDAFRSRARATWIDVSSAIKVPSASRHRGARAMAGNLCNHSHPVCRNGTRQSAAGSIAAHLLGATMLQTVTRETKSGATRRTSRSKVAKSSARRWRALPRRQESQRRTRAETRCHSAVVEVASLPWPA